MANDGNGYPVNKIVGSKAGPACSLCKQANDRGTTWVRFGPYREAVGPVCAAAISTAWTS